MARSLLLLCLTLLTGCGCPHRFHVQAEPDELPSFIVPQKIRVALVLGSGGVRGMAHVGVIEELEKAGVPIDIIVGCSAGSIVGALYADNPCVEEIYDTVWGMRSHTILDIELSNTIFGLSQGQAMMEVLDEDLEARTFEELKIPLIVVATDLHTGELVPFGAGDLVTSVRASCSIPLVFEPCEYMGRVLVDGSVVNPVPAKVAHDLGAEIIIAVDLAELLDKTYPRNLLQVAERSAEIAFIWQNQECTRHAHVVIRPKTCNIGCFNDNMKQLLYEAGKEATLKEMPRIKALLEKHKVSNTDDVTLEMREVTLPTYVPKVYY